MLGPAAATREPSLDRTVTFYVDNSVSITKGTPMKTHLKFFYAIRIQSPFLSKKVQPNDMSTQDLHQTTRSQTCGP